MNQKFIADMKGIKRKAPPTPEQREKRRKACRAYAGTQKYRDKRNATARAKYRNNPEVRFRRNITCIMGHFIRGINDRGSKLAGCNLSQFKDYVESKFEKGMTWENRGLGEGKWSLGHRVTFVSFKGELKLYIKALCWYENVIPVWEKENQKRCRVRASEEEKQALVSRYLSWVANNRQPYNAKKSIEKN